MSVDAPTAPVMLGEKVSATIKANYYFGGPVAEKKVKYKITSARRPMSGGTPLVAGDFGCSGPGYRWFAADSLMVSRLVAVGDDEARALLVGTLPRCHLKWWPRPL